ncbi:hypothetical protein CMV_000751 [Castanea mollissima]|uniref:Uncharacterized protein n=1 Tax=Castanea mollissima TaxID=60419 RepID=A0A8J4RM27_9ROSI|nr:hypothetical protein CMV_000751 [Castanea mollissima]
MAYRRKQQQQQGTTSSSLSRHPPIFLEDEDDIDAVDAEPQKQPQHQRIHKAQSQAQSPASLAAKAIRASSAHRDSSLSSAYGYGHSSPLSPSSSSSSRSPNPTRSSPPVSLQDSKPYEYTSMKSMNESKHGFWGVLARKAKAILDEDTEPQHFESPERKRSPMAAATPTMGKYENSNHSDERRQNTDGPARQKGLGAIASSLNYIGGTIGNALEEGLTIVESRTADIIQETRKHMKKKPGGSEAQNQVPNRSNAWQQPQMQPQMQTDQGLQLKASRDVAMAMAAKAKLLLRELKTVKADLAFAKERCAQLEEENKILRENRERGSNPEDDDLIRLQLETLLAEKARLAHENSVYARENRFLREVVEYHQLTMQDVVYLDEGTEQVTEVYPILGTSGSNLNSISSAPTPQPPPGAVRK